MDAGEVEHLGLRVVVVEGVREESEAALSRQGRT